VFVPFALSEFVDLIGGTPTAQLNLFWIFAATAGLAFYAGARAGVRVQFLLGSIAVIISWTALWDKILADGIGAHWGIYRGLLGILAIGLLAAALYVWRTNPGGDDIAASATAPSGDLGLWKASELVTGAGIAAVIACSLGITAIGNLNPLGGSTPPIQTSDFWDIMLLLVSLGLVAIGSQIGTRGPVYIGAIGLVLFLVIAGLDLNSAHPNPFKFGGWPWVLLILGLISLGLSLTREVSLGQQPRRFADNLRRSRG
jgi:NADH:ubiquinone oxidoreductase subunit 6 (subunit J)